jgi:hypothetical protein
MPEDTWGTKVELTGDTKLEVLFDWTPYTSSEDKKGHEVFLGAKFPKSFAPRVTRLREAAADHYKTNADVVRDAISIGLEVIGARLKQPGWEIERLLTRQRAKIFEHARIYRAIEETVGGLAELCNNNDKETAVDDLASLVTLINKSRLKDKYLAALKEKLLARGLGYLLKELE